MSHIAVDAPRGAPGAICSRRRADPAADARFREAAPRLLNLGCGARRHPAWTNLDRTARGPDVRACDLRYGIPFPDAACAVVYLAHVLEHFTRTDGRALLRECHRVLRPGGLLRVAVPDLETIARLYLHALQRALAGDRPASDDHTWLMLELYDQAVREQPGGEMAAYLRQVRIPNEEFVLTRLGTEARAIMDADRGAAPRAVATVPAADAAGAWIHRLRGPLTRLRKVARLLRDPKYRRSWLVRRWLGPEGYSAYRTGCFRRSGEVHQWMYDRHALCAVLAATGFCAIRRVGATESGIPGWHAYQLDADAAGRPHKPDSLYMEAVRPAPQEALRS
jgi:predicted SAM-dependent methyltransferase